MFKVNIKYKNIFYIFRSVNQMHKRRKIQIFKFKYEMAESNNQ